MMGSRRTVVLSGLTLLSYYIFENTPDMFPGGLYIKGDLSNLCVFILDYYSMMVKNSTNLHCIDYINQTIKLLEQQNISARCSVLQSSSCDFTHEKLRYYATPVSVYSRAASCESLELPNKTAQFEKEEIEFPLAFSILTYG